MSAMPDLATLQALVAQLDKATFQIQVYFAVLCAIVFYEWINNLSREIKCIWKSEWTLVKACYLFIRYSGLLHAVVDLYAFFGLWSFSACNRFVAWIPAIPIFGVLASHIILLTQCHAVWNRPKWILMVLLPLMFSEVVIMSVSSFTQIEPVPILGASAPCLPGAKSAFCILYFAMPMLFDLSVTVLTAIKVLRLRKADIGIGLGSSLLNTIIQQSFQYFIFITAANITNILYYAIDVYDPTSSLNGPLAIIATELFACRLTLSLRDVKNQTQHTTFIRTAEKRNRHFVKVVFFGDGANDNTELTSMAPRAPSAVFHPAQDSKV